MKLKYADYYEKRETVLENGVPKVENGRVVTTKAGRYVYAVVDATPEEITLYKRFKRNNPEGKDWYKESVNGIPLWHTTEFEGMEVPVSSYKDENGNVVFRINKALRGALEGIKKSTPTLGGKVDDSLFALLMSGGAVDLNKLTASIAGDSNGTDNIVDTDNSGTTEDETEQSETPEVDNGTE